MTRQTPCSHPVEATAATIERLQDLPKPHPAKPRASHFVANRAKPLHRNAEAASQSGLVSLPGEREYKYPGHRIATHDSYTSVDPFLHPRDLRLGGPADEDSNPKTHNIARKIGAAK